MENINVKTYCTMTETQKYCNLKNKANRLKPPRLEELYKLLFNEDVDETQTHNSLYDVEICAKCYFKYLEITKS